MRKIYLLIATLLTFCAHSQTVSSLHPDAIPLVDKSAKDKWSKFVAAKSNKAYAIALTGAWSWVEDKSTEEEAKLSALSKCEAFAFPCFAFAINDTIIWNQEYSPQTAARRVSERLKTAQLEAEYDKELNTSMFVKTTDLIKSDDRFHSMTPPSVLGGKTVTTKELRDLIVGDKPPVVIEVLPSDQARAVIPTAVILAAAGFGDYQTPQSRISKFEEVLLATIGSKDAPVVFYCASYECWWSYNASLRAIKLGFKNVIWYRGGLASWKAAKLPLIRANVTAQL